MAFLKILSYVFQSNFIKLSQTAENHIEGTADNGCSIWRVCTLASTGLSAKYKNLKGIFRRVMKGIPLNFQTHWVCTSNLAGVKNKMHLLELIASWNLHKLWLDVKKKKKCYLFMCECTIHFLQESVKAKPVTPELISPQKQELVPAFSLCCIVCLAIWEPPYWTLSNIYSLECPLLPCNKWKVTCSYMKEK